MFSEEFRKYAQEAYQRRLSLFGELEEEIRSKITCLEQEAGDRGRERALLMKFLYGTMPLSDAGDYEFHTFLAYVDHGLWLREHISWCRSLPEDLFLHYVLYYRINTEAISDCREFFYGQLKERIREMELPRAVLEVNYWCAEQAGYAASDERTLSPMAVYRSGSGRCGEESTFVVSALRSVGIPARQVYAPWWAHCDDNHAWVEVYVDGAWHFLGACEPEEALDRGWFVGAASRALLVHSRTFFDYWLTREGPGEECIGREGSVWYYNCTGRYAQVQRRRILVKDRAGKPADHATVRIEVLNMADFRQIASLLTDEQGEASLLLGLGDVRIHGEKDGWYGQVEWVKAHQEEICVTLDLPGATEPAAEEIPSCREDLEEISSCRGCWEDLEEIRQYQVCWEAPKTSGKKKTILSEEKRKQGRLRRRQAEEIRARRLEQFDAAAEACGPVEEQEILRLSRGNLEQIRKFLSADSDSDLDSDKKEILRSLAKKDYRDVTADTLEAFLSNLQDQEKTKSDQQAYGTYVLCPRIGNEELTPYPPLIRSYFSQEQKEAFRHSPVRIWDYIQGKIREEKEEIYPALWGTPFGCLRLGVGSTLGKRMLFVAICRSLGIPARLNPQSREPEFWQEGSFHQALGQGSLGGKDLDGKSPQTALLCLSASDGAEWIYSQTWSIGKLEGTGFVPLMFEGITFSDNELKLELREGLYRLITTSRLPNGNQHGLVRSFFLKAGEVKRFTLQQREEEISSLLCSNQLEDFDMKDQAGARCILSRLLTDKSAILAFLEVGQEPTEHVLNEMLDQALLLSSLPIKMIFLLESARDLEHPTLQAVLEKLPQIRVFFDPGFEHAEPVARQMYVEPEKFPLLAVIKPGMTGVYGCSGYHVGSVELMIKILKLKAETEECK